MPPIDSTAAAETTQPTTETTTATSPNSEIVASLAKIQKDVNGLSDLFLAHLDDHDAAAATISHPSIPGLDDGAASASPSSATTMPSTGTVVLLRPHEGGQVIPAVVVSSSEGFEVAKTKTILEDGESRLDVVGPHVNLVAFDERGASYFARVFEGTEPGQFSRR